MKGKYVLIMFLNVLLMAFAMGPLVPCESSSGEAWVTQHPLVHHPKNPVLGYFGWDETQPDPTPSHGFGFRSFSHMTFNNQFCFPFPHPLPTYPLPLAFSLPSSFSSLFPLIIFSSFFRTSSFFFFWFSLFFLCFFLLFSILCGNLFEVFMVSLFSAFSFFVY